MDVLKILGILAAIVAGLLILILITFVCWTFLPPVLGLIIGFAISGAQGDVNLNALVFFFLFGLLILFPWLAPRFRWKERIEESVGRWWKEHKRRAEN